MLQTFFRRSLPLLLPCACSVLSACTGLLAGSGRSEGAAPREALGVWERATDGATEYLVIEPRRLVRERGGESEYFLSSFGPSGLMTYVYGAAPATTLERHGDTLVFGGEVFMRSERPAAGFEPEPPVLGDEDPSGSALEALLTEIAERSERDQAVREAYLEAPTPEAVRAMRDADRDNTAWIVETLGAVGWIDAERFGPEAARGAFLIVQHSGDLGLMEAALPFVRADWEAGRIAGGQFALLYDRLELSLGRPQLYGSQIQSYRPSDGSAEVTCVAPLLDPEGVDERRAAVGLEPLRDYLARFGEEPIELFEWPR